MPTSATFKLSHKFIATRFGARSLWTIDQLGPADWRVPDGRVLPWTSSGTKNQVLRAAKIRADEIGIALVLDEEGLT